MKPEEESTNILIEPVIFEGQRIETKQGSGHRLVELGPSFVEKMQRLIKVTTASFFETFQDMAKKGNPPAKINLEFGISIGLKGDAFIAKASTDSSIKIKLEWDRKGISNGNKRSG